MIVITLTDCPIALRGDLTKWLQEINTGVYVGQVSARVRDEIWDRVRKNIKTGQATMVFSANNEQHMNFRVHNTLWKPIDFDGLKLMLRPSPTYVKTENDLQPGFSKAARMRKVQRVSKKKHASKPLPERYLVVDVETTGLSAEEHEIIEIGAIRVCERQIKERFHALVKTKKNIPKTIQALTGLSDEVVQREGRKLTEVLADFLSFADDFPVVSHNADFDYGFLRTACEACDLPLFSNSCIDTLSLSRRLVRDSKDYKLATLLDYFGIGMNAKHRSEDDCLATKQLYEKLIELLQSEK
jgi:CRISPR-associated protein Cas2